MQPTSLLHPASRDLRTEWRECVGGAAAAPGNSAEALRSCCYPINTSHGTRAKVGVGVGQLRQLARRSQASISYLRSP